MAWARMVVVVCINARPDLPELGGVSNRQTERQDSQGMELWKRPTT